MKTKQLYGGALQQTDFILNIPDKMRSGLVSDNHIGKAVAIMCFKIIVEKFQ